MSPPGQEGATGELAARHAIADRDRPCRQRAPDAAEAIAGLFARLHLNRELVDIVDPARRVHPAGLGVEALVDEELPPGRGTIGVQPLPAGDLLLGAEEE